MIEFLVFLKEAGETHLIRFDCHADDADHAHEQAANAYPGCTVVEVVPTTGDLPYDHWLRQLTPGDEVLVVHPQVNLDGVFTVDEILGAGCDSLRSFRDVVCVKRGHSGRHVRQLFAYELLNPSADSKKLTLRLVVDVTYDLNGASAKDVREYLNQLAPAAAGDGLLTGISDATVADYNWTVTEVVAKTDGVNALANNPVPATLSRSH